MSRRLHRLSLTSLQQLANERRASSSSSARVRSVSARGGGEAGKGEGVDGGGRRGEWSSAGERGESARRVGVRFHVRCADAESWLYEQRQQQQQQQL